MRTRLHNGLKNTLSIIALLLSLAALQSPLWRPKIAGPAVTMQPGGTAVFAYSGEIEKATILHSGTATLSAGGPRQIVIHAHQPGRTHLLIHYKNGQSKLYEVIVRPS